VSEFVEIDRIEDPDGVGIVAVITKRDRAGGYRAFSFALYKEYTDKSGAARRSHYLNERHIDASIKLLRLVEKRLLLEQDKLDNERRRRSASP
jgi:hypothetical protein